MSLYEAWNGARVRCHSCTCCPHATCTASLEIEENTMTLQTELAGLPNQGAKLLRLLSISRIFAAELLGQVKLAPYGYRALRTHRTLPRLQPGSPRLGQVSLLKDVR